MNLRSVLTCAVFMLTAGAQSALQPVRLAIIGGSPSVAAAGDLLTVELSHTAGVTLLERAQIDRLLGEQALAAANGNRDYVKLGEILGADGLIILEVAGREQHKVLSSRLVAVKPGVALALADYPFPLVEPAQWSRLVANQFEPLLPKLNVLTKDAVPISLLNLRSAVKSEETEALERELNALLVSRLLHEREVFVLERRKLEAAAQEKEFKGVGEPAFWNGSYVLDGTVDKDGYNRETVTLSARLAPPGKEAMTFEVQGKRADLPAVINDLVVKVLAALRKESQATGWKPADEAAQYFEEAKWALKWGMIPEAQAAIESAWVLGKRDTDCAIVRVRACLAQPVGRVEFDSMNVYSTDYSKPGKVVYYGLHDYLRQLSGVHYDAAVAGLEKTRGAPLQIIYGGKPPEQARISTALRPLRLYDEFDATHEAVAAPMQPVWRQLGLQVLARASDVLMLFYYFPVARQAAFEDLAEMRARARSVADRMMQTPSVRATYWTGDRYASHDELYYSVQQDSNIFKCALAWGCFWQERPEDCVALYRELMSSDVFSYIDGDFWCRLEAPLITAWQAEDTNRVAAVWEQFAGELKRSSRLVPRMEVMLFQLAHAQSGEERRTMLNSVSTEMIQARDEIVANKVEIIDPLAAFVGKWRVLRDDPDEQAQNQKLLDDLQARLTAMEDEWSRNYLANRGIPAAAFDAQKSYLTDPGTDPGNSQQFNKIFLTTSVTYSRAQVAELQPLVAAYKSNALQRVTPQNPHPPELGMIGIVESRLNMVQARGTLPARPTVGEHGVAQRGPPSALSRGATPASGSTPQPVAAAVRTTMAVQDCEPVPATLLPGTNAFHIFIRNHFFYDGKLWLNLTYQDNPEYGSPQHRAAAAVLDLSRRTWEVISYPAAKPLRLAPGEVLHGWSAPDACFEIFDGSLYVYREDGVKKYNLTTHHWTDVTLPDGKPFNLFALAGHLYAANDQAIIEMESDGDTRVLASTRRRPAASTLDSLDKLGGWPPVLFTGPENILHAAVGYKVFAWQNTDWREVLSANFYEPPRIIEGRMLYRTYDSLWLWQPGSAAADLCFREEPGPPKSAFRGQRAGYGVTRGPKPLWQPFLDHSLLGSSLTLCESNLYFFYETARITNADPHLTEAEKAGTEHLTDTDYARRAWTVIEKDGCHGQLVCLMSNRADTILIPLRFDPARGLPPLHEWGEKFAVAVPPTVPTCIEFVGDKLCIFNPAMAGIWFVPKAQIDKAVAAEK